MALHVVAAGVAVEGVAAEGAAAEGVAAQRPSARLSIVFAASRLQLGDASFEVRPLWSLLVWALAGGCRRSVPYCTG